MGNMRSPSSRSFSARERASLQGMLDSPERVEIHGPDRAWRAGVLAAVMATAGMGFGVARAGSDPAYLSHIDAPSVSFFAKKAHVPSTDAGAGELMRRAGAKEIASTAVSVKPTVYPIAFPAEMNEDQVREKVMQFVFSGHVMEPALGGAVRLQNNLVADLPKTQTPISWSYVAKENGRTGCAFLISDQHAPAIGSLARATGLSTEAALDFAVMHESAHCAQQAETVTAAYDVMMHGRVLPRRIAGGMLGAQAEEAIASGKDGEVFMDGFLSGRSSKLSAERFADAFAMMALMAQSRINGQQIEGLIAWRLAGAATHNTASFLAFVRDQVRRDASAFGAMQTDFGPGFDAQAIAAFLRPHWKAFEKAEITARRESSQGLKDVLVSGMKARSATSAQTASPPAATHGRSVSLSN